MTYIKLESLGDIGEDSFPFYVQIDNFKLTINIIKYEASLLISKYFITLLEFENYLSIKNNEPQIIKYDDSFTNKINCQFDIYNTTIKCIYVYFFG